MIDWSELKTYENNKYRSFEELCYQIAKGLYGEKGRFTSIDDSGGGDGVEFYLTLENGDEWGWQAKFYYPQPRLSYSNRKKNIEKSLKKACEMHPRLKKWILCTPTNFTPRKGKSQGEQVWFDDTLRQSIPPNMDVDLEHWGDSAFNNWLSEPRFNGKRLYFFGELELDLEWFKTQFGKQIAGVGDKFDSSLHTEIDAEVDIHALLGDHTYVKHITGSIEKLEEVLTDLNEAIDNLRKPIHKDIEWDEEKKEKVADATAPLKDVVIKTIDQFKQSKGFLQKNMLFEAQAINWDNLFTFVQNALETYRKVIEESDISEIKYTGESQNELFILDDTRWLVHRPESIIANLLDDFLQYEMYKCKLINHSELKIFGNAGVGKTHIACNICDDRLNNGLPSLFIRGSLFTTDQSIEAKLRETFDIPSSYSFNDFLQALSAAAEAYHTRIPLIIDGLNEATSEGALSKVWEKYLKGFVYEIAQIKNVVIITTCRTSYKKTIWNDEYPPYSVDVEGFDSYEVTQEAIEKYFKEYKIKADLTFAPLSYFKIPIYLKIFCETKNRERKVEKQVYVGEQTLFEVFDEYLKQCNEAVCKLLDLDSEECIVQSALIKMAIYLWKHRNRHIPRNELARLIDGESLDKLKKSSSKMFAIESEGLLLVFRDMIDRTEVMRFTYDLLGGYLIAQYLVQQASNRRQVFLRRAISKLFGKNRRMSNSFLNRIRNFAIALFPKKVRQYIYTLERNKTAHPMYDDVGRCLAALLPAKTGQFLHQLSDNEKAFGFSIRGLFEISIDDINDECINLVKDLFALPQNRASFFKLAESTVGHPDHPFSASFWSEQLSTLSMVERDLSWSEHVRLYREEFEKLLERFEETCQSDQELSDIGKERLHLMTEHIMWILTSTVRPLRDLATRALYWYGRRFPQEFFDLVLKSFTIDDPYVPERMLAATYGVAMAYHNNLEPESFLQEVLPVYGRELYENMFKPKAPHATTHILARDYAKRTIDIALIHHPDLLTEDERGRITPPFTDGGIRDWDESEHCEEGFPPIQMDFDIYTLDRLIKYDSQEPGERKRLKANVYWRMYELEFTNESFVEIDSQIAEENRRYGRHNEDERKTDRYGKKYSWIAFFELAGFRQDNDLLPDRYEDGRISDADIDPSFPDEHQEYNIVTEDYLGDRQVATEEWVLKTPSPDLTEFLKRDQLLEEQTSWVLLDGHLGQEDKPTCRKMFAWMQGLIVKPKDLDEILEILNRQKIIDGNSVPSIPKDYRTYAGEIPWCDTYPPNNWQEFSFLVRKYTIPKKQFDLFRGGEPISLIDDFELWDNTRKLIENDDEKKLNELLRKRSLEIKIKTVDEEKFEHKDFEVLVPVRDNVWEESCSAANPRRSSTVPSREISDFLNLYKKPQSFDFFEKDGDRCASISFRYGDIWSNPQSFTYLRRDLLERFLAEIGGELIWVIWGRRLQLSENHDGAYKTFQEVKTYQDIQKASGGS